MFGKQSPRIRSLVASIFGSEDQGPAVSLSAASDDAPAQARLTAGWYTFEVLAIDGRGQTAFDVYTWFVGDPDMDVRNEYQELNSGSLSATEGEPLLEGWYTFEVRAIDETGKTASNVYSWFVDSCDAAPLVHDDTEAV